MVESEFLAKGLAETLSAVVDRLRENPRVGLRLLDDALRAYDAGSIELLNEAALVMFIAFSCDRDLLIYRAGIDAELGLVEVGVV